MKSILVIDMPKNCSKCPCWDRDYPVCCVLNKENKSKDYGHRPKWCPLKPMPQKLEYKGIEDDNIEISKAIAKSSWYRFAKPNEAIEFRSFAEGYNNCVDEILGKKNETSRTEI